MATPDPDQDIAALTNRCGQALFVKYFGPFTDPAITIKTLARRLIADEIFAPASAANRAAAGRRLVRTDQTEAALRYIITAKRVDGQTRTLATRLIESGEAAAAAQAFHNPLQTHPKRQANTAHIPRTEIEHNWRRDDAGALIAEVHSHASGDVTLEVSRDPGIFSNRHRARAIEFLGITIYESGRHRDEDSARQHIERWWTTIASPKTSG